MSRMTGAILLVGSVPAETATEAMRTCAEGVGPYLSCLPDGETGYRAWWVTFLAARLYHGHPALETIRRPKPAEGKERWHIEEYGEEGWLFKVKEGVGAVQFAHLGYAQEAQRSYQDFCTLRAEGVIPPGVRFQVSLPLTESAIRSYLTNTRDYELLRVAYEEAMEREITQIVTAIPAHDLVIQWDICIEVLAVALQDQFGAPWQPSGDPFERYLRALMTLAPYVPDQTLMGCHLCYGDLGHKHLVEPTDLGVLVRMANAAHQAVPRRIDYYHMPVPRNRDDVAYFAPLQNLTSGEAKLYLGLVHHTNGVDGSLRRVRAARQSVSGFGISTECGFGRRPQETIPELLRIHREVAATL
jgi:hypothetical protein